MNIVRRPYAPIRGRMDNGKRSVQNLNSKHAITPKRYEIGCQLLLITNRKSHTGFRLVPTLIIWNDLERRNSPHFVFSPNSIALQAHYVTVAEDRPVRKILSPSSNLPLLAKTNALCSAVSLR